MGFEGCLPEQQAAGQPPISVRQGRMIKGPCTNQLVVKIVP